MTEKQIATNFLEHVASGQVDQAFEKYVAPHFIHHNQYFPGDRESLKLAMSQNAAKNPNKSLAVKMAVQEGNLVALHSRVKQNPTDLGVSVVHIFRIQNNLIEELWDVGQPIAQDSPNRNGPF